MSVAHIRWVLGTHWLVVGRCVRTYWSIAEHPIMVGLSAVQAFASKMSNINVKTVLAGIHTYFSIPRVSQSKT